MNESVQTSVEQINLLAAQLRYKIDCALQQSVQYRHQQISKEALNGGESSSGEICAETHPFPIEAVSAAAGLEIDYLHREILDLKHIIDKLSNQLRIKDSALKQSKDDFRQEKMKFEIMQRDHRQITADAKANERYVKCVQTEYELLQNMTSKSQEAFQAISNESLKHAIDFDKTAKMVQKQMKEITGNNVEIRNLKEELKRLHADVTNQRAAAGVDSNSLKFLQLELGRMSDREVRLDARISSLTERVERERHINKMLNQTVEATESKANNAMEGIQIASEQQVDLLGRLNKANTEIVALKATLEEQQSRNMINIDANDKDLGKSNDKIVNSGIDNVNSRTVTINNGNETVSSKASDTHSNNGSIRQSANASNMAIDDYPASNGDKLPSNFYGKDQNHDQIQNQNQYEYQRSAAPQQDSLIAFREDNRVVSSMEDVITIDEGVGVKIEREREKGRDRMNITPTVVEDEINSTLDGGGEGSTRIVPDDSNNGLLKKQKTDFMLSREEMSSYSGHTSNNSFDVGSIHIQLENRERDIDKDSKTDHGNITVPGPSSHTRLTSPHALHTQRLKREGDASVVISKAVPPITPPYVALTKVDEVDLDDERCQICLDHPFGLMVLCAICKRALHSGCAKKVGLGLLTGKDFKCPKC